MQKRELRRAVFGNESCIGRLPWLNTEVLVYDGHEIYTCPIKARNLSGRTGRGDTTFAGYINERLTKDIPTALQTATALVSLKMETPGPFTGTRQDVEDYIKLMY